MLGRLTAVWFRPTAHSLELQLLWQFHESLTQPQKVRKYRYIVLWLSCIKEKFFIGRKDTISSKKSFYAYWAARINDPLMLLQFAGSLLAGYLNMSEPARELDQQDCCGSEERFF